MINKSDGKLVSYTLSHLLLTFHIYHIHAASLKAYITLQNERIHTKKNLLTIKQTDNTFIATLLWPELHISQPNFLKAEFLSPPTLNDPDMQTYKK